MTFMGVHNFKPSSKYSQYYGYAITNKRILTGQKNMIAGKSLQSVSLQNINDISFKPSIDILTIDTIDETIIIGLSTGKSSAERINIKIHEVLDELQTFTQTSQLHSPTKFYFYC